MNVSLPRKLEAWVKHKARSAPYETPEQVVADAVRQMEAEERRQEKVRDRIRKELERAAQSLARGEGRPANDDLIRDIVERGQARLAAD